MDTTILKKAASGTYTVINSGINVVAMDSSFSYALVGAAIFKYNSASNSFTSYKTNISANFIATSTLLSYNNRLILWCNNNNSLYINVLSDVNGSLVTIYDNSHLSFTGTPSISISPQLTKVCINGVVNNVLYVRYFHVNYTTNSWTPVSFPTDAIFDKSAVKIIVD